MAANFELNTIFKHQCPFLSILALVGGALDVAHALEVLDFLDEAVEAVEAVDANYKITLKDATVAVD
jgi:hypothetical protein